MKMLKGDTKGFTILEVLIAMAIFSIGILGIAKMQTSSSYYNVKSRLYTKNAFQSAGRIEQTINLDYDNDGDLNPTLNDRYEITKIIKDEVLDPDRSDMKFIDTVKRIDISVWKNIKGRDDDNDGTIDEPYEGQDAGELFFRTTTYKAVTY